MYTHRQGWVFRKKENIPEKICLMLDDKDLLYVLNIAI